MKKLIVFILLLMSFNQAYSKRIILNLDGAVFKDKNNSRWELYFSIPDNSFSTIKLNDNYLGKINLFVKIYSVSGIEYDTLSVINFSTYENYLENRINLTGQINFIFSNPGQYTVSVHAVDVNDTSSNVSAELPLLVRNFDEKKLSMSDIQLVSLAAKKGNAGDYANQMFEKSNYYIYPNPGLEIASSDPQLVFYNEFYNAKNILADSLYVEYSIINGLKKNIVSFDKWLQVNSNIIEDLVVIPINIVPSGAYYIQSKIKSNNIEDSILSVKKFYLYNPQMPVENNSHFVENETFELSEFSTLTEEQTELEFNQSKIIAKKDEISQYSQLSDLKAKQRFLFRFWKIRDLDSNANINEAYIEHKNRIQYANTFFSFTSQSDGWSTDRGKIVIKYGLPTERTQHIQGYNERAYEEWLYTDIQGGAKFYFVDRSMGGKMQLVHSTITGEAYNPNWYNLYVPFFKDSNEDNNQNNNINAWE